MSGDVGLRERKRSETHARIQREAIRLFLDHGFEAVTLDQIAGAAGVSRRSLFHYFASKEEIVLSTKAGFPTMVAKAVAARPADEPLLEMLEKAFADLAGAPRDPQGEALARLISSTPSLAAGDQAKYDAVEQALTAALAAQKGLSAGDMACRVAAAVGVDIFRMATEAWISGAAEAPEAVGHAAFARLRDLAAGKI
ncbi:MAG TPA: helix-turn-helix domain-containing protein [Brevundimonas sp.]|uniref:TetR/AcrR family transcriptional regulator n=1 Tax=Brevundimonas sp. TaxID=1871086 RepID=UPI002DE88C7F|nr:helix-turn-helix domain-containing protein [Brevundimonas sp.]